MRSEFGKNLKVALTGESHGDFVSAEVFGLPKGFCVDMLSLSEFMKRRQGGNSPFTTPRAESDIPVFESGIDGDILTGERLVVKILNQNKRSLDYSGLTDTPRPSHADYTAPIRFGSDIDMRGGGHFSARLTAPLCVVGGICKQILEKKGIYIGTHLYSVGNVNDKRFDPLFVSKQDFDSVLDSVFPVLDMDQGREMLSELQSAKERGDSLGGVVECGVIGLGAGYGDPLFEGMENRLSSALFGLGGVRGIEFGLGFEASKMRGSQHNDAFYMNGDKVSTKTNNCGGILGGISNGMPVIFRVAFKPTASISVEQNTVSLSAGTDTKIKIKGRHDPCIAIRALPCVEALSAIVICDVMLSRHSREEQK